MLTPKTISLIEWTFNHGSFLRILPYKWNSRRMRLELLNTKSDILLWNLVDACYGGYVAFTTLGFLTVFPFKGLENNSSFILHLFLVLTSLFAFSVSIFRRSKMEEIVYVTNKFIAFVQGFEGTKLVKKKWMNSWFQDNDFVKIIFDYIIQLNSELGTWNLMDVKLGYNC